MDEALTGLMEERRLNSKQLLGIWLQLLANSQLVMKCCPSTMVVCRKHAMVNFASLPDSSGAHAIPLLFSFARLCHYTKLSKNKIFVNIVIMEENNK